MTQAFEQEKHTVAERNDGDQVREAIMLGINDFFTESHASVGQFVNTHFRYPGCWKTNRAALGFDLLRAPVNLFWAPIFVCVQLLIAFLGFIGFQKARLLHSKIPGGLNTNVQRHINTLVKEELLNPRDLKRFIARRLESISTSSPDEKNHVEVQLQSILDEALNQLMQSRTATADITNTIFSTALGALAFKKFTPGGIGIGVMVTALYVKQQSVESFFLGPSLGGAYYSLFPPEASGVQVGIGVVIAMIVLSILASFSGLLTDPLQSLLRIHHRRLNKMIQQMEVDLRANSDGRFKTLDPYIARILDLFDLVRSQVH